MPLLIVIGAILLLVILVAWFKLNTFLSFLIVSLLMGLALGMDISAITQSIQTGIGKTLGSLIVVIVAGSMLGKLVAESGAGQRIAGGLMKLLGPKYVQWSLMITAKRIKGIRDRQDARIERDLVVRESSRLS